MAKMFYSLEEAAQRLGRSALDVQQMAASGQLQEFKDRDKLMFKREQVDLLAGGAKGDSAGFIPLAGNEGSSMGLALDDSGSGSKGGSKGGSGSGHIELDDPAAKEKSGISIFDTESTEEGDPSAVTRITETRAGTDELTLESVGSGSGLLDLTREGDDTSLGADLMEDVYKPDEEGASAGSTQGASGLFETTAAPSDVAAAAAGMGTMGMVAAEAYDGAGSGMAGGVALGVVGVLMAALVAALLGLMNADNPIAAMVAGNLWMYVGIGAVVMVVLGVVGWMVGKRG